ncbi:MAG TPA: alcohol dehydrogenase catalytic domain-containing protein [Puia sp.]|nr:alcohol dehydrogenase catalytic domain-containing protein [Puia sp.]
MTAMVLEASGHPLVRKTLPLPTPSTLEVLIKVIACGICRTDLHVVDGELPKPRLPLIPGHEIVGRVVRVLSSQGTPMTAVMQNTPSPSNNSASPCRNNTQTPPGRPCFAPASSATGLTR